MEHTGLYTNGIIAYLVDLKASLWVEMAIKIKRSMGLHRGTDDKASSVIIAEYAMRFSDRVRLWKPIDTRLSRLKDMIVQRDRIVNALTQLTVPLEEMKSCGAEKEARELERLQAPAINGLKKSKEKVEASIQIYITSDETINKNIELMCSIKCIYRTMVTPHSDLWYPLIPKHGNPTCLTNIFTRRKPLFLLSGEVFCIFLLLR